MLWILVRIKITGFLVSVKRGPLLEALVAKRTNAGSLIRVNQCVLLHKSKDREISSADFAFVGSDVKMCTVEVIL